MNNGEVLLKPNDKISQALQRLDAGHYLSKDVIAVVADKLLKEIYKK